MIGEATRKGQGRVAAQSEEAPEAFPRVARLALSAALCRRVALTESGTPLPDLLAMATLGGAITPSGADLAMAVERLGSEDDTVGPSALWARCLLAFYATALLWPELVAGGSPTGSRMA